MCVLYVKSFEISVLHFSSGEFGGVGPNTNAKHQVVTTTPPPTPPPQTPPQAPLFPGTQFGQAPS